MIIIYVLIMIGFFILWLIARKECENPKEYLRVIARLIFRRFNNVLRNSSRRESIKRLNSILCDKKKVNELEEKYIIDMIEICLKVLLVVSILSLFLTLSAKLDLDLSNDNLVQRNGQMQGDSEVDLYAYIDEKEYEIPLTVGEEQYNYDEIELLYQEYKPVLEKLILGENISSDKVTKDLNFPTSIKGYPFTIEWETSDYSLVQSEGGLVVKNIPKEGQNVIIKARSLYFDYENEFEIPIFVCREEMSEEDKIADNILQEIKVKDDISKVDTHLELPTDLEGEAISWRQKVDDSSIYMFALGIIATILIVIQKNKGINKEMQAREDEMVLDYAIIVNQLVLFLQAGMTLRGSFYKLVADYQKDNKEKKFIYEELINLCQELDTGMAEGRAYENLGKRCNVQLYYKFTTLLSQNIKKGTSDLISILTKEAENGLKERKAAVKVRAEQATTKLLVPMMMMLGIVMIIIILPAFLSFQI